MLGACSLPADGDLVTGSISQPGDVEIVAPSLQAFVSETSWSTLEAALVAAIVDGEDGVRVEWKNADTGEAGTVTPLTPLEKYTDKIGANKSVDMTCRTIAVTAATDARADEIIGQACAVAPWRWVFKAVTGDAGDNG